MKKTLLLTGMACILSCQANAMDIKPYIGADMGASHTELQGLLDGFDDNFAVANINAGIRFNDYFGLEASVQSSWKRKPMAWICPTAALTWTH